MASYCKQCSILMWGEDERNLAEITQSEDWAIGLACWAICEGCGQTQVDPDGKCIRADCPGFMGKKHA